MEGNWEIHIKIINYLPSPVSPEIILIAIYSKHTFAYTQNNMNKHVYLT